MARAAAVRAVPDTSPRRKLLQQQKTNPAYVTGQRWDVLAWNSAACSIIADFEALPVEERNIVRLVFTNDELRRRLVDWEGIAQRMLAQFRASSGRYTDNAQFGSLIAELSRLSPEFARWWPLHEVRGRQDGRKEFIHPHEPYSHFRNGSSHL